MRGGPRDPLSRMGRIENVGTETIVPARDGKGILRSQEALFAAMGRNAACISDYLELPYDHVVEIGREIEI